MSVTSKVHEMEQEFERLQKLVKRTVEFLRGIGPKDPRSGGFIANRVLDCLGEPSNYLVDTVARMQEETKSEQKPKTFRLGLRPDL